MDAWKSIAVDAAESEGWHCSFDDDGWAELSICSDAGEDFSFSLDSETPNAFWKSMCCYAEDFDAEEHAVGWWRAGRGEPDSIRILLDDADKLADWMEQLCFTTRDAFVKHGIGF